MTLVEMKTKLHQQIDNSDEQLLKKVYAVMNGQETENIDEVRRPLIMAERQNCLTGSGKSYSWDEVKSMAINGIQP